jgi:hypothetical protein
MADQADAKPPIVVSPAELAALYERIHEREWNKDSGAYKNPVNVQRTAVHLGRVAAMRLADAFARLGAIEAQCGVLALRIADLEKAKSAAEAREEAAIGQALAQIAELGPADREEALLALEAATGRKLPRTAAPGAPPLAAVAPPAGTEAAVAPPPDVAPPAAAPEGGGAPVVPIGKQGAKKPKADGGAGGAA